MLTYEIVKELKDAGFPFKLCRVPDYPYECNEPMFGEFHYPKLSELIEACGDGMFRLNARMQGDWEALIPHKYKRELVSGIGSTPEEAVANLWVALNKK